MAERIAREAESLSLMIRLFCKRHHSSVGELCDNCRDLSEKAQKSLLHCPYGAGKPVCGRCSVNCFPKDIYARLNTVMRYAGPRMLYKHPLLVASHLLDALKKPR